MNGPSRWVWITASVFLAAACGSSPAASTDGAADGSPSSSGGGGSGGAPDGGTTLVNVGAGSWSITTARPASTPTDDLTVFAFSQVDTHANVRDAASVGRLCRPARGGTGGV